MIVEYCEFAYGNNLHFGTRPDGVVADEGASKELHCRLDTWRYNYSHDNDGPEWYDTDCSGTITESVIENSDSYGVMIEANDEEGFTVSRNHFANSGIGDAVFGTWGTSSGSRDQANLYVLCSHPGTITKNIFESDTGTITEGLSLAGEQADIKFSWQFPSRPETKNWTVDDNLFNRSYTSGDGFISTRGIIDRHLPRSERQRLRDDRGERVPRHHRSTWPMVLPIGDVSHLHPMADGDSSPLASSASYDPRSLSRRIYDLHH